MTIVTQLGVRHTEPGLRMRLIRAASRFKRFINNVVAEMIAHRERQAALFALRHMSDRELKDIGLDRGCLEHAVDRKIER